MFDKLTALGYGIVVFAIVIGMGIVLLLNFAQTTAGCSTTTATAANGLYNWNSTSQTCMNTSGSSQTNPTATTNLLSMSTYLGTGSGGLASWTTTIIALAVGLLFLGAFFIKKSKGRY